MGHERAMGQNYADDDSVSFKRALDDISSSESSLEADLFSEGSPISSYQLVPVARFGSTITEPPESLSDIASGDRDDRVVVRQSLRIWRYRRRTGDGTGRVDGEAGGDPVSASLCGGDGAGTGLMGEAGGDFLGAGTGLGSATTGRVKEVRRVNPHPFPPPCVELPPGQ
ncbi:hypothetical protein BSL78_24346 [Apostichopus japonicus]|uniref:Uncharacterized protein n=1 Tax=Stichopus japonicus TaxID=307972 RepID=A0A2G8JSR6_STIJA|nr:hypothetical protein BSL78_24346 [Apostichopus japonicus]